MKRSITLLTGICCLFLTVQSQSITSLTPHQAYQKGIDAIESNNHIEALPLLEKAAEANIPGAYAPLINMYADGSYNGSGIGNYHEAFYWTLKGFNVFMNSDNPDRNLGVTCMMYYDPLCFLTGDYHETIRHATTGYSSGMPELASLYSIIGASYLKLDDKLNATKYLEKGKSLSEKSGNIFDILTTNALLAKIAIDNKNYDKAIALSKDAATIGGIPLASFVYGVALIKTKKNPEEGKKWIKRAVDYKYSGIFEINCFKDEIEQYWETIENTDF